MLHLNNKGWSLREMVFLSSILLAFLLVAIFMIIRLYHGLNKSGITDTPVVQKYLYEDVERNVLDAGIDYYNEYYNGEENIRITVSKIRRKGLITSNELHAEGEKRSCDGYVEFQDGIPEVFIKCENYMTKGYEE
ncbi:MAG: hypothetical protein HFI08_06015 [Bacilli bacterium]|nr:hypothetical protein [Bacilli bacterium]